MNERRSSASSATHAHKHILPVERLDRSSQMDESWSPPSASCVDLFMLKFKQLEAQLAPRLGAANRRRELSRLFSALGKTA